MEEEIWKLIEGYEGKYSVSNMGRVRNDNNGKILNGTLKSGYKCVYLDRKTRLVHRLVADKFCKKEKEKNVVNHKDGNRINNKYSNLQWTTQTENVQHAHNTKLINNHKYSIIAKNINTGDIIEYESILQASQTLSSKQYVFNRGTINRKCKNGEVYNGYIFSYKNESQKILGKYEPIEGEIWRKCKDSNYDNIKKYSNYAISNYGRVRTINTNYLKKIKKRKDGYCTTGMVLNGKEHKERIHRLVIQTFNISKREDQIEVNHKDGNKFNNKLDNLEWVTRVENMKDPNTMKKKCKRIKFVITKATGKYNIGDIFMEWNSRDQCSKLFNFKVNTINKYIQAGKEYAIEINNERIVGVFQNTT